MSRYHIQRRSKIIGEVSDAESYEDALRRVREVFGMDVSIFNAKHLKETDRGSCVDITVRRV